MHESRSGPLRHFACAQNPVAFRSKLTLDDRQDRLALTRMTRFLHASVDDLMVTCEAFGEAYFWYRNCLGVSEMRR
jgi:hypothetical protein